MRKEVFSVSRFPVGLISQSHRDVSPVIRCSPHVVPEKMVSGSGLVVT